jgi:hypothetical protein
VYGGKGMKNIVNNGKRAQKGRGSGKQNIVSALHECRTQE